MRLGPQEGKPHVRHNAGPFGIEQDLGRAGGDT